MLDAGHTVPVYWYGKSKVASLFGSGPINGMDAFQTLSWIYRGGGLELYHELLKKIDLNYVGFFAMPMPTQPLGWFKKPITDASQLKGLKYRTVGLAADLFQEMGSKVTQLPGGEIIPALERGVIDAFEFNNPTSDMRFGSADVIKNYELGSFHQAMEFFEIQLNQKKWDAMPKDLQAIWRYAAEAASPANYWTAMKNYPKDLQILINKDKVNVSRTPNLGLPGATRGLGHADQAALGRGSFLQAGGRIPARVGQGRLLLLVPERRPVQDGLRAHLQDQAPGGLKVGCGGKFNQGGASRVALFSLAREPRRGSQNDQPLHLRQSTS